VALDLTWLWAVKAFLLGVEPTTGLPEPVAAEGGRLSIRGAPLRVVDLLDENFAVSTTTGLDFGNWAPIEGNLTCSIFVKNVGANNITRVGFQMSNTPDGSDLNSDPVVQTYTIVPNGVVYMPSNFGTWFNWTDYYWGTSFRAWRVGFRTVGAGTTMRVVYLGLTF